MTWRVLFSQQLDGNPSKVLRIHDPLRHLQAAGKVAPLPLETLGRRRGEAAFLDKGSLDALDLVFLHVTDLNATTHELLLPFLRAAAERGVAIVCDSDDPYFVPADGCSFQDAIAPHLDAMRELCALAHVVSVTTGPLRLEFEPLARDVVVVPNHLDVRAAPTRRSANAGIRVGWCGGPTHTDDLAAVLPAIQRLQAREPVELVLFGMFDRDIASSVTATQRIAPKRRAHDPRLAAFGRLADALRGVRYRHVPSTSYADFPARLAELDFDIGLCPLLDTRFNRCRSAVKLYQYAAAGTVTIASDVAPYRGECEVLVENTPRAWLEALQRFTRDPGLRATELERQREFVAATRNWRLGVARYEALFAHAIDAARAARSRVA